MAQAVLDFIAENPERHDQSLWVQGGRFGDCGTTMCVAGTANYLANGLNAQFKSSHIEGRRLLGLSYAESDVLFYDMSEKSALRKLEKIAAGEQFTEEDFWTYDDQEDTEPTFSNYYWEKYLEEQQG